MALMRQIDRAKNRYPQSALKYTGSQLRIEPKLRRDCGVPISTIAGDFYSFSTRGESPRSLSLKYVYSLSST